MLPELSDLDLENPSFSASGPAEYTVSFGRPCKVGANVRVDSLLFAWPRVFSRALVAVYRCEEFWPHYDVKTRAVSVGKSIYVMVDSVARHAEQDAETVPLEEGPLWRYVAKIGGAALCKTLREVLHIEAKCKMYGRLY
ncbi:hypothetical protein [Pyrobaculum calidifontis]|uniref:Uncharacterized protein n=1 Tax=Pyrobaculum calidifontis (strain DSM 21063 / JCM 11548 / VA1) TaxID=410359 RepID=A3MSP8_PYRCJ|nr:hypothetical protein [Pyrobaculum calidifontis]ABO07665.1 conserved hypothetical protein [Pyrobaculum calidifontis JCM 11548]